MKFIADLHIHSHFSRATSKALDPEHLSLWAKKKGITVIGTGDLTHPGWMSELQDKLIEAEDGLYRLRPDLQKFVDSQVPSSSHGPTRFLLSGEISCIYKKNGKTRKVHQLVLMPDIASVHKLNARLARIGNISSDGRPILGLDSRDLLEIILETSNRAFFIPAHIWTPWFSLFGSKSGFDSLEECFEDLSDHIHALETGLSSDPPMNRCLSSLDKYLLVSNSDAHSLSKLGREANIFDTDLDYNKMIQAMTDGHGFMGTIELFPEEGKYHLDGHRKCQVRLQPAETIELQEICPVCGGPLTVGVLHRVYELSDRDTPRLTKDFFSLIPLAEILSELLDCGVSTKKVMSFYDKLLLELEPELQILLDVPLGDIEAAGGPVLAEAIGRMRRNQVIRLGGYDGEYGKIRLFDGSEKQAVSGQISLFGKQEIECPRQPDPSPRQRTSLNKRQKPPHPEPVSPGDPILDPLNREQKEAVLYQGGNLLVVAGPGTGKTLTLTHRIAHMIRIGLAAPDQVLALTFTRKAAKEMGQRIPNLLKGLKSSQVPVSTFHRFCLDLLRSEGDKAGLPHDFILCSEVDAENLAKEAFAGSGEDKRSVGRFVKALPFIKKASILGPAEEHINHEFFPIFQTYQRKLRESNMLDLDDLEVEVLRLLRDHADVTKGYREKFPWIFVDEYQDTNPIQVELLKTLVQPGLGSAEPESSVSQDSVNRQGGICAIGDPDQAIYRFRGADVKNFYRFSEDFPGAKEIVLTRNYRSTKFILQGSAALMGKVKPLQCETPGGKTISLAPCRTESEEAEMIVEQIERLIGGTSFFSLDSGRGAHHEGELSLGFGDIGVLYRLNAQGDALEEALDRAGIPYSRSGETPLTSRYPVNILLRFFQSLLYPDNPYYTKLYNTLIEDSGINIKEAIEALQAGISLPDLIDLSVSLHKFDCSSEETSEALGRLKQLAEDFEEDMALFLYTLSLERGIDHTVLFGDRVAIMSIHAAKGLEWPVVFITGCEDQLMPCSLFGSRDGEEERRLFYVGMTRTRFKLILSYVNRRLLNGRILHMNRSPFIDAIPQNLCDPLEPWGRKPKKKPNKQLDLFSY